MHAYTTNAYINLHTLHTCLLSGKDSLQTKKRKSKGLNAECEALRGKDAAAMGHLGHDKEG